MIRDLLNGVGPTFCEMEVTGLIGFGAFTQNQGYINSIQYGTITLGSTVTSNTATISAVGSNAFVIFLGLSTDNAAADLEASTFTRLAKTDATTITATRNTGTGSVTVSFCVVDPKIGLVTAVQQGTITITAGTSNTATISAVDTALTAVFYLGNSTTNITHTAAQGGATLTDGTTVTAFLGGSGTGTVAFVAVTFAAAAIEKIQQYALTSTANSTTDAQTITAVVTANSMIAYGGMITASDDNNGRTKFWGTLTDTVTVTYTRSSSHNVTRTHYGAVIEFKPGVLASVNRGGLLISAATSATATVTAVNTAKTLMNWIGFMSSVTGDSVPNRIWSRMTLTNATTFTGNKNTSNDASTPGYEGIEFN